MHRYRISYLAGGSAPATVEAWSEAAALEAANVLVAGTRKLEDRGTVHFGHVMTDDGEVIGCAAVVDRLPSDFGKGAYRTAGELARKPSDRGGSTRKHRSPRPFNAPARVIPTPDDAKPGTDAVVPSSGTFPNRAELAAAQRELAAAGLGTLNGRGFGTAVMVNPEHYAGVRNVKNASSAPLAILAARVTPRSDSEPRTWCPKGFDPQGDVPAS